MLLQITYQDKATQTEKENTIEDILKAITTLCTKVDSMDNEIQKLKSKFISQSHDYKHAEICQSKDTKHLELEGDVMGYSKKPIMIVSMKLQVQAKQLGNNIQALI
ncbi:hypothetical protein MTR67_026973 [Solanum verrucosum]|uniref:Uncharacterized protein n=1 Tax=Solanum verrucosum TaxID=315347 RepID=A0AAF0R3X2_SOLVR|nr:hypothetical protein MTR67_026973 [Solanum verrucosum]